MAGRSAEHRNQKAALAMSTIILKPVSCQIFLLSILAIRFGTLNIIDDGWFGHRFYLPI
jgi:hypothetical protein